MLRFPDFQRDEKAKGSPVASWTSEAPGDKEINLEPGGYAFHEEVNQTGYRCD